MTSPSFDWNLARAFLATAEGGSFSAAARILGTTQPTVGRQVAALEEELGVALFRRAGNAMRLTEAGEAVMGPIRAMQDGAAQARLAADGHATTLDGTVRISASESVSAFDLPPIVCRLRETHPGIHLHIVTSNTLSDLVSREADIGIRNVRPDHPELITRRLPDARARFYASRGYLERRGRLQDRTDVASHVFVGYEEVDAYVDAMRARGWAVTRDHFPVLARSHLAVWQLCRAGAGIAVMNESIGDSDPDVERVLPDVPPWEVPVWLTCHRELHTSRRIRVVFDALADAFSQPDLIATSTSARARRGTLPAVGANFYYYFTEHRADPNDALQELRAREFAAGRYEPAYSGSTGKHLFELSFPPGPDSPTPGPRHASPEEALEASDADGTGSIIDIQEVADAPRFFAASPVSPDLAARLFGSSTPSRDRVQQVLQGEGESTDSEAEDEFFDIDRGQARYLALQDEDGSKHYLFAGYSVD